MNVKFLGAAKNVTGSKFLLEIFDKKILIDCGIYQEREFLNRNWDDFPVLPSSIDFLILTHGHLDHCGYLPKLVNDGFKGKIFCTEPTVEIAKIILLDSGKIQEEDAFNKKLRHKREGRKGRYPEVPLYTGQDAKNVFPLFAGYPYNHSFKLSDGIEVCFYDAGHILGSAIVEINVLLNGNKKKIIFSGDLGRKDKPILEDPTFLSEADVVFMESTYGNRVHNNEDIEGERLSKIINKTIKEGGNIVMPVFALERAQEILFYLSNFMKDKTIPEIPVFVDSPMAINITEVFKNHLKYFDDETRSLIEKEESPFDFSSLRLTRTVKESKNILNHKKPVIIMAGSGMCTGGRIKHHLISNITRKESSIVFVGYQAKGTLGREIIQKPKSVRILGNQYEIKANIENVEGFSAHADRNELLEWINAFSKKPKKVFIVHGEEEASESFASLLREKIKSEIIVPDYLSKHSL